jgi:hypothetical protein
MGEVTSAAGDPADEPNRDMRKKMRAMVRKLEKFKDKLEKATADVQNYALEAEAISDAISQPRRQARARGRSKRGGKLSYAANSLTGVSSPATASGPVVSRVSSRFLNKRYRSIKFDRRPPIRVPTILAKLLVTLAQDATVQGATSGSTEQLVCFKTMKALCSHCRTQHFPCTEGALVQRISRLRDFLEAASLDPFLIETDERGGYRVRVRRNPSPPAVAAEKQRQPDDPSDSFAANDC